MAARDEYRIRRLGLAGKYRIGQNDVRTGKIGVKGLVVEYGGYSGEYSPTVLNENQIPQSMTQTIFLIGKLQLMCFFSTTQILVTF